MTKYVFDPDMGWYIHPDTGECFLPVDLEMAKRDSAQAKYNLEKDFQRGTELLKECILKRSLSAVPAEDAELLPELILLAKHYAGEEQLKRSELNPDLEIGQTIPYDQAGYTENSYHGVVQLLRDGVPCGLISTKLPLIQAVSALDELGNPLRGEFLVTRNAPEKHTHQVPNTVDIEHKVHIHELDEDEMPAFREDLPEAETGKSFYQSLYMLVMSFQANPQASWIKWMPTLVDFLIHRINIVDSSGEISIPDLLSTFRTERSDRVAAWQLLRKSERKLEIARKQIKHLRKQLYSMRGRKHATTLH